MQQPGDFEKLKGLLFDPERRELQALREQIAELTRSADQLAARLPQAIVESHAHGTTLVSALKGPITDSLRAVVRDDPEPVAEALFPVMGPAIRKSIASALASFTENLNRTLEISLSARGFRWRLEAARTGVPFGQVVLKHTLRYRVEEAFLIHRENGLLIAHQAIEERRAGDKDAVSGMLTVVQDFVRDSFLKDASGELEHVQVGEHLLVLLRSPHAILACLVRGIAPRELRDDLAHRLETIHDAHRAALAGFVGDRAALPGVDDLLRECLKSESLAGTRAANAASSGDKKTKRIVRRVLIFGTLLAVVLGVAAWTAHRVIIDRQVDALVARLEAESGYVLVSRERVDGRWVVRALRDPVAEDPATLEGSKPIDPAHLVLDLRPYVSADPDILVRRARMRLQLSDSIGAKVEGGALQLSGTARPSEIERLAGRYNWPDGITSIDSRELKPDTAP